MASATKFPSDIFIGQWQTADNPNPRLAFPISSTDTTFTVTAVLKDATGATVLGNFLAGIKNELGYVETVWVPIGSSVDGLTFMNVVRGVALAGLDYTTSDPDLAVDFPVDAPIYCNISAILFQMMIGAMTGVIASGGASWLIGRELNENVSVQIANGDLNKPAFRYNATLGGTGGWEYSNDGVSYTPFGTGAGLTGGAGITIGGGVVSVNTADTSKFVTVSSGAADSTKVPVLNSIGQLAEGFINTQSDNQTGTANTTTSIGQPLSFDSIGRLVLSEADDTTLNTEALFAGIASTASTAGNTQKYISNGLATVTAFTLAQRQNARLWTGQSQLISDTTTDTVAVTTQWRAQTFTPATGEDNVSAVILNFTKTSSPNGSSTVAIYATTAGVPSGAALATAATVLNSAITSGDNTFSFATPLALTPGTVYAIVWASGISAGGNLAWNYQSTDVYAGGQRCTSTNSGGLWTAAASTDMRFTVQYRGIAGEPVFLSTTAGGLELVPPTGASQYVVPVGHAVTTTTILVQKGKNSIFATYNYTASAAGTVDTEITIGFRPMMIFANISLSGGRGAVGIWLNAQSATGFSLENKGAYIGSNAALTWQFGNNNASLLYHNGNNTSSPSPAASTIQTLTVQATSANTVTIRRVVTITGTPSDSTTVNLYILGY